MRLKDNPSVSLSADSSLYTRELPTLQHKRKACTAPTEACAGFFYLVVLFFAKDISYFGAG